jgi:hypothetical protein
MLRVWTITGDTTSFKNVDEHEFPLTGLVRIRVHLAWENGHCVCRVQKIQK